MGGGTGKGGKGRFPCFCPQTGIYSVLRYHPQIKALRSGILQKSSWLHKQPNRPRILQSDPIEEMRKIIKYYPKKISSLKQITLANKFGGFKDESKKLYRKIIGKYRKGFLRYFCIDLDQDEMCLSSSLFLKSFRDARVLYVQSEDYSIESYKYFSQILKHNKLLSHVQINTDSSNKDLQLKRLRYLLNLKRLQLLQIPAESCQDWKRSCSKIEILTIFDTVKKESSEQFVEGIKRISQLSSLKKLNCELRISDSKVLDEIPFEDFKNKNIAHDFRIVLDDEDEEPQKINFEGLEQTDFLGISYKKDVELSELEDPFQLSSINLQQQAKNIFFLEQAEQTSFDSLLKNCHNIITLDLFITGDEYYQCSLPNLNHLTNLRNLSLTIFEYENMLDKEWRTLTNLAQENKNITYLSLNLNYPEFREGNSKNIEPFFDALKDSLTTLLLSFEDIEIEEESLEVFSKSISSLHKLKSLYLNIFSIKSLETSMPCSLEELKLKLSKEATTNSLELILKGTPKLVKLVLEVETFDQDLNFSKVFSPLTELKDLELILNDFPKKNWNSLVKALPKLKNLEMLKVSSQDMFSLVDIDESEIRQIIKDNINLKLVALGSLIYEHEALRIAVQKKYFYNDDFLIRFKQGLLDNLDYKIFYV